MSSLLLARRRPRPKVSDAAATSLLPLRPLTVGEIMDMSFLVIQRNANSMIGMPFLLAMAVALTAGALFAAYHVMSWTLGQTVAVIVVVLLSLLAALVTAVLIVWMGVIVSRVTLQTVLGDGFAPSVSRVTLRTQRGELLPVFGFTALGVIATMVVGSVLSAVYTMVIALVGMLTAFGTFGAIVALVTNFIALVGNLYGLGFLITALPAYALESRRAPGWIGRPERATDVVSAYLRSFALIGWRQSGRSLLLTAGSYLVAVIIVGLAFVGSLIVVLLYFSTLVPNPMVLLSQAWLPAGLFSVLVALTLVLSYAVAAQTIFYLDLRMRREGLDLAMRFDAAPVPQPRGEAA